jgi:hypothetical protein
LPRDLIRTVTQTHAVTHALDNILASYSKEIQSPYNGIMAAFIYVLRCPSLGSNEFASDHQQPNPKSDYESWRRLKTKCHDYESERRFGESAEHNRRTII